MTYHDTHNILCIPMSNDLSYRVTLQLLKNCYISKAQGGLGVQGGSGGGGLMAVFSLH